MKYKLIKFFTKSDKFFLLPIVFSSLSSFSIITFVLLFYQKIPPRLPLFYSLPWGQSQLTGKEQFFLLPGILILITFVNSFIVSQLHPLQIALKRIIMLSLILINLIILVTALKILLIFI